MDTKIKLLRTQHEQLRLRTMIASAEFSAKARYVVVPRRHNYFTIIDCRTGTTRAEVIGRENAVQSAQKLEDTARFHQAAQTTAGKVACGMLRWTFALCVLLSLFALMGIHNEL